MSDLPKLQSDQLGDPGAATGHVDLGPRGADELLHRVVLRSVTYSIRVPTEAAAGDAVASGGAGDISALLRPTITYDVQQILDDIEDNYLKNKALIIFTV